MREKILQTAFELFISKGYDHVIMNEIICRSEVSKGGMYHYFRNKEELYEETLKHYFYYYYNTTRFRVDPSATLTENLRNLYKVFLQPFTDISKLLKERKAQLHYYFWLIQSLHKRSKMSNKIAYYSKEIEAYIKKAIENAISKKEISVNINPSATAKLIHYALEGLAFLTVLNREEELEKKYEEILQHLDKTVFN